MDFNQLGYKHNADAEKPYTNTFTNSRCLPFVIMNQFLHTAAEPAVKIVAFFIAAAKIKTAKVASEEVGHALNCIMG